MIRSIVTLIAVVSLLLCLASAGLWVRSYKTPGHFSGLRGGDRYTLASAGGRLTLFGPPPPAADPAERRTAAQIVAGLRNDQIFWEVFFRGEGTAKLKTYVFYGAVPLYHSPAERCDRELAAGDTVRPLLAALDDPQRFAAAHMLLLRRQRSRQWPDQPSSQPFQPNRELDGRSTSLAEDFVRKHADAAWGRLEQDRLKVSLRKVLWADTTSLSMHYAALGGDYDPAQLPAIRDQWHRRLDVPIQSVPYWPLVSATAVAPLLWAGTRIRGSRIRGKRERLGLCLTCGYDLRHSPGKCPECGMGRPSPVRAVL